MFQQLFFSRQTAGLRGSSLIVNLQKKTKINKRVFRCSFPAIPYCIDLMEGPYLETNEEIIKAFRPKISFIKYLD